LEPLLGKAGVKPEHLPWLGRVLPPAFRCPDQGTARSLAEQHPHAIFVGPDDVVWRGRTVEPPTAASRHHGALALRDERHRLAGEIGLTSEREGSAASRHRDTARALAEVEGALAELDGRLLHAEQERARAAAVEQSLGEELSRLRRELEAVGAENERNRKLSEELVGRRAELEQEVAGLGTRPPSSRRHDAQHRPRRAGTGGGRCASSTAGRPRRGSPRSARRRRLPSRSGSPARAGASTIASPSCSVTSTS
jgi:hypothetical protein